MHTIIDDCLNRNRKRNRERRQEYQRVYAWVKRIGRCKVSRREREMEESIRKGQQERPYMNTIVLSHRRPDSKRTPQMADEEASILASCCQLYSELSLQHDGTERYRVAITDLLDSYVRKARQALCNGPDDQGADRPQDLHGLRHIIAGLHQELELLPQGPDVWLQAFGDHAMHVVLSICGIALMSSRKRKRTAPPRPIQISDDDDGGGGGGAGMDAAPSQHISISVPHHRKPRARLSRMQTQSQSQIHLPSEDQSPIPELTEAIQSFVEEDDIIQVHDEDARGHRGKTKWWHHNRRQGRKRQIDYLNEFQANRGTILDELLRHDGISDQPFPTPCATCHTVQGEISCTDCVWSHLLCASCIREGHAQNPFHRLKKWNGTYYESYSLYEAGLVIQLRHDGLPCPHPSANPTAMTIMDMSGIHKVNVRSCDCQRVSSAQLYIQAVMGKLLFHAMTLQAKTNVYDFYNGIVRVTDGSGLRQPKSRYHEFSRAVRCYRHLRMAKRGGHTHDAGGIENTALGSLVVECPACPHPGRNLPEDWENQPRHLRFLYCLFLAVDANFKLMRKNCLYQDLALASGWAYSVPRKLYLDHLASHEDEEEMKNCDSTFAAVNHANMPGQKRFSTNGVGAVVCARHYFFRPNGVGDLERGERYVNMGFILLMTVMMTGVIWRMLVISYDIACQFSKNFEKRMKTFPEKFRIGAATAVTFLVPKFHLPAHGSKCQMSFSFNLTAGVGRTHGEGIEANWSITNGVALSTREMSEEARREALDDNFGAINWYKLISMGMQIFRSLKEAVSQLARQQADFDDYLQTFPMDVIACWDAMINAWDEDKSKPNLYEEPVCETTLADVRLELSEEEAHQSAQGAISLHQTMASTFLSIGLDLKQQQRVLRSKDGSKDQNTTKKKNVYMPVITTLISAESNNQPTPPHDIPKPEFEKLWLPSDINPGLCSVGVLGGLVEKELCLCIAEAEDALHEIRRAIHVHMGFRHYKKAQVNGPSQKRNTRVWEMLNKYIARHDRHFERYNAARSALEALQPDLDAAWRSRLLPLRKSDLVDPSGDDADEDTTSTAAKRRKKTLGEGRKEIPWIWRTVGPDRCDLPQRVGQAMTTDDIHDSMRVTYAKSRARVHQRGIKRKADRARSACTCSMASCHPREPTGGPADEEIEKERQWEGKWERRFWEDGKGRRGCMGREPRAFKFVVRQLRWEPSEGLQGVRAQGRRHGGMGARKGRGRGKSRDPAEGARDTTGAVASARVSRSD
ncbi:hypothetical protein EVG20_g10575 [Dentipellis fragilis]|uniref:CxC2-like cysteine cluster KDZ transposase-associated domain-containing protein n=1 Tax=Dentipellis fragilis TaxID=205917 RepID=A0A4Y9XQH3_9AGAM|nr:hypothetical protein EVG20_g10575 [Dentipellis fragilis]